MIYCIEAGEFVKIGYAKNPDNRIPSLQTGSPHEIKVLFIIDGDFVTEKWLHKKFRRFRHRGEWFRSSPELLREIYKIRDGGEIYPTGPDWPVSPSHHADLMSCSD